METLILGGLGALALVGLFMLFGRKKQQPTDEGFTGNVGAAGSPNVPEQARAMTNIAAAHVPTRAELEQEVRVMLSSGAKIEAVKLVRERTSLGLKEAKELVESAPKALKEGADKAEAEKIKKQIEDAGGKIELK